MILNEVQKTRAEERGVRVQLVKCEGVPTDGPTKPHAHMWLWEGVEVTGRTRSSRKSPLKNSFPYGPRGVSPKEVVVKHLETEETKKSNQTHSQMLLAQLSVLMTSLYVNLWFWQSIRACSTRVRASAISPDLAQPP